jgi:hypothetical protein
LAAQNGERKQPTEEITQTCPTCQRTVTMIPYDIGSGPEMSCPDCEWCWGADGQSLLPIEIITPEEVAKTFEWTGRLEIWAPPDQE